MGVGELSTVSTVVLFGGIAVFIIILAIFIVWKLKCEHAPASARSWPSGEEMTNAQGNSVPAMTTTTGRQSTINAGSNTDYQYIDENRNTAVDNDDQDTPDSNGTNSKALTTFTFASPTQQQHTGANQTSGVVATAPPSSVKKNPPGFPMAPETQPPGEYSYHEENNVVPYNADRQYSEYDNPPAVNLPGQERSGSDLSSEQPGSNLQLGNEHLGVYNLASPLDAATDVQGEVGYRTSAGSGDYFELEKLDSPGPDGSEFPEHYSESEKEVNEGAGRVDGGGADVMVNSSNVYLQLEDER